jgi:hypothetical protein
MKALALIIIASLLLAACEKNKDQENAVQLNGSYFGTFSRTGMDTANVMFQFQENTFQGSSNKIKYPALCHGSFDLDQRSIYVVDSCSWTADFDWTLILNGSYNISFANDLEVRIWRTNGNVTDEYLLRKIVR